LLGIVRDNLLRGLAATVLALVAAAALAIDALAVAGGRVPGGLVMLTVTALVAAAGLAVAATALVRLGQTGGHGYRAALRHTLRLLGRRPPAGLAVLATMAVPAVLATVIPVTAVLLPGFVLFALHAVLRKTTRGHGI
jgi:hypothetical protein